LPESRPKILILGGTAEAARLALALEALPVVAITSLAGRTANPAPVAGAVRSGGFGGAEGLATYLTAEKIDCLIDATHPYATRISQNAVAASSVAGCPLLRLERPLWRAEPGDNWIEVADEHAAMRSIPAGERVFLALGRQHIAPFAARGDVHFVMRMIDPPQVALPPDSEIVLARPAGFEEEKRFLVERRIGLIVCRNSGGEASYAKVEAARALALPVLMIARPPRAAVETVATATQAADFIRSRFGL